MKHVGCMLLAIGVLCSIGRPVQAAATLILGSATVASGGTTTLNLSLSGLLSDSR